MEPDNPLNNPASVPPTEPAPSAASATSIGGESLPDPSGMGLGSPGGKKKRNPMMFILIGAVVLIIIVIIAVIVAVSSSSSQKETEEKNQYQSGYDAGVKDQKEASEKEYIEITGKDFRIYRASADFGSFEIPIPKTWSLLVNPRPNDGTITGTSDPDYIDQTAKYHVFTFDQKRADYDKLVKDLDNQANSSKGAIVASDVVVSGISGRRYKGTVDAKNNIKAETVIIPLREKVIVFKTDDPDKYSSTFNNILNNTKLNP